MRGAEQGITVLEVYAAAALEAHKFAPDRVREENISSDRDISERGATDLQVGVLVQTLLRFYK